MKTWKRPLLVALAGLLALPALLWGSGQKEAAVAEQKEPLTFMIGTPTGREPKEGSLVFEEWQKGSGVKVKFIPMAGAGIGDKITTMLASGDLPDMMSVPRTTANTYGLQGAYVAINKYLDKAPNMSRLLSVGANPYIYASDGNLYFMPSSQVPYLEWGWLWRADWAKRLGIKPPTTIDEWKAAWRAVKKDDPESIPWLTQGMGLPLNFLTIAWGIGGGARGSYTFENGDLKYPWTDPRMKEIITFMRDMYKEGILWNEFITATSEVMNTKLGSGKVFSIVHYQGVGFAASYGQAYVDQQIADKTEPIAPPKGPTGLSGTDWMGPSSGWGMGITSKCKDIPAAVRFWDYNYSKEGAMLHLFGKEGVTYQKTADGKVQFTDTVKQEAKAAGLDLDTYLARQYNIFLYFIGCGPAWDAKIQILRDLALGTANPNYVKGKALVALNLAPINPPIWNVADETTRMNKISADLTTHRGEWLAKFVAGQEPMDKWDEFVAAQNKIGVDEFMKLVIKGYERYYTTVGKQKGFVPTVTIDTVGLKEMVGLK